MSSRRSQIVNFSENAVREGLFSWLPQSGFQPEHRPSLELYIGDAWDTASDLFRCEVGLPVRPL